ncbi:MAG: hypothetical protein H6974_10290 [Gammaproteobacteria bacterium]|nr:hypothetical protein [Gammaproteobacteria bacterium]
MEQQNIHEQFIERDKSGVRGHMIVIVVVILSAAVTLSLIMPRYGLIDGFVAFCLNGATGYFSFSAIMNFYHALQLGVNFYQRFGWYRLSVFPINFNIYAGKIFSDYNSPYSRNPGRGIVVGIAFLIVEVGVVVAIGYKPLILTTIAYASYLAVTYFRLGFVQPLALFLGISSPSALLLHKLLTNINKGFVASFLDRDNDPTSYSSMNEIVFSYRQSNWEANVQLMMRYCPLIILDGRGTSPFVEQEILWLKELGESALPLKPFPFVSVSLIRDQRIFILISNSDREHLSPFRCQELTDALGNGRNSASLVTIEQMIAYMSNKLGFLGFYSDEEIQQYVHSVERSPVAPETNGPDSNDTNLVGSATQEMPLKISSS